MKKDLLILCLCLLLTGCLISSKEEKIVAKLLSSAYEIENIIIGKEIDTSKETILINDISYNKVVDNDYKNFVDIYNLIDNVYDSNVSAQYRNMLSENTSVYLMFNNVLYVNLAKKETCAKIKSNKIKIIESTDNVIRFTVNSKEYQAIKADDSWLLTGQIYNCH